ncbi:Crp/Fnr family transcriptional regulator [Verrucomicrobium spinosum]|uniref:Crp/Fnr family transcriptional regulator n=1 Tax=Verrucomicrobium spinosum TaxID=2736 RepID=UPI000174633E|nr:cyclic nucleotide-binding domain-containing protein [Verrucomicrobium spinosum]
MRLPNIFEADTPPVPFPAGTVIFTEGEDGDSLYVVKEGEVELKVKGRLVEVVKADGFFGEMAIIENGPRTATAVASVDCELIPINEKRFEFMVHEVPNFALHVMRGLSRRLRSVDEGG